MRQTIVLTVIADDQPGIIRRVSAVLHDHKGSWHHSSMSHLAGRFAGILQGEVSSDRMAECLDALHLLKGEGIEVIARAGLTEAVSADVDSYALELVGNDRPGIVADITEMLASHEVNVQNLETVIEGASMAGGELFRAYAHLQVPVDVDVDVLTADLESLANDLMVDINFEA